MTDAGRMMQVLGSFVGIRICVQILSELFERHLFMRK